MPPAARTRLQRVVAKRAGSPVTTSRRGSSRSMPSKVPQARDEMAVGYARGHAGASGPSRVDPALERRLPIGREDRGVVGGGESSRRREQDEAVERVAFGVGDGILYRLL